MVGRRWLVLILGIWQFEDLLISILSWRSIPLNFHADEYLRSGSSQRLLEYITWDFDRQEWGGSLDIDIGSSARSVERDRYYIVREGPFLSFLFIPPYFKVSVWNT